MFVAIHHASFHSAFMVNKALNGSLATRYMNMTTTLTAVTAT